MSTVCRLLVFSPLATFLFYPVTLYAQTPTLPPLGPSPAGLETLQVLLVRIISISVGLAFVALVIMLFYGGIRFMISGGDAKGLQGATQTITYAVVGILLMVAAWLILKLVYA